MNTCDSKCIIIDEIRNILNNNPMLILMMKSHMETGKSNSEHNRLSNVYFNQLEDAFVVNNFVLCVIL